MTSKKKEKKQTQTQVKILQIYLNHQRSPPATTNNHYHLKLKKRHSTIIRIILLKLKKSWRCRGEFGFYKYFV